VNAGSDFFIDELDAPRLINVAISRARQRLFLLASPQDMICKEYAAVTWLASGQKPFRAIDLACDSEFPKNLPGKVWQRWDGSKVLFTRPISNSGGAKAWMFQNESICGDELQINTQVIADRARQERTH